MFKNIDSALIRNVLTLRYNPIKETSIIPLLNWTDFLPTQQEDKPETVERYLKTIIHDFIEKEKPNRIALALSGGIDSLLILTLFREIYPDLNITCISAGFNETDEEVKSAKEISRLYNAGFESIIFDNFLNNLPKQISIIREPKWHYYWYFVAKKAKQYSNVLVTGDGGDELFGGYVFRYNKYLQIIKKELTWLQKVKAYLRCHERDWVDDQEKMFGPKANFTWDTIYNLLKPHFDNQLGVLEQVLLADYSGKLMYDWAPSLDKIHSHFQMKGFSPILNENLIKFASHIPIEKKYDFKNNIGKLILRQILETKKYKSEFSKMGFSPDLIRFWNNHGKEITKTYLDDARIVKNSWLNRDWVQTAFGKADSDIRYLTKLLSVLAFEIWYRVFVTKEMKESDKLT